MTQWFRVAPGSYLSHCVDEGWEYLMQHPEVKVVKFCFNRDVHTMTRSSHRVQRLKENEALNYDS